MRPIFLFFLLLIPVLAFVGLFDSEFEKQIKHLSREDLEDLCIEQYKKDLIRAEKEIEMKKDYNKLYKNYSKYFDAYKAETKIPIIFRDINFGLSTGISAILNTDNVLKSNFDFYIEASFYYKRMRYGVAYQPLNKNVIISVGVRFP